MILGCPASVQSEISSNIRLKTLKMVELELQKILAFYSFRVNHRMARTRQFQPFFRAAGLATELSTQSERQVVSLEGAKVAGRLQVAAWAAKEPEQMGIELASEWCLHPPSDTCGKLDHGSSPFSAHCPWYMFAWPSTDLLVMLLPRNICSRFKIWKLIFISLLCMSTISIFRNIIIGSLVKHAYQRSNAFEH